jgi:hypothetical protein
MRKDYLAIAISLVLICSSCAYDWDQVQKVVDEYYLNGAYPGAVLRVSNKSDSIYTYETGNLTGDSKVPFSQ